MLELQVVRTLEGVAHIGGNEVPVRVELLRSLANRRSFKCRLLRREFYRIQPTFPQGELGQPKDSPSDEEMWIDWSGLIPQELADFEASSLAEAVERIIHMLDDGREPTKRRYKGNREPSR